MKKKNIRPQQVAPVQRETTANSSQREKGVGASFGNMGWVKRDGSEGGGYGYCDKNYPFAGDDAE